MLKDRLKEIERLNINCGVNSVYDMDGKTTQELLNQFFQKINAVIETTNASMSLLEYLVDAGLQKEIAEKLIQWIEDGTLKDIIDEDVLKEIHEKIDGAVDSINEQKERVENILLEIEDDFELLKKKDGFNVKYYGAIGDGITDDTEAFKKAIDEADSVSTGKTVLIPAGAYLISENLEIPSGVILQGTSNSVIKFGANHVQITLNGSDIQIKDLIIDASDVTTTNVIKDNTNFIVRNIMIKNVTFKNIDGAQISVVNLEEAKNVHILNCVFKSIKGNEVKCIGVTKTAQNIFIKNNTFNNIEYKTSSSKRYGVYIDSEKTLFSDTTNAVIENNYFDSDIHACVYIDGKNITVNNNSFITKSSYIGNCHFVLINNTECARIKNNFYNLSNNLNVFQPILKVENGKNILINDENIIIDGALPESKDNKPLFSLKNADAIMDNITATGKHHTFGFIDISGMNSFIFRNSNINLTGTCEIFMRVVDTTSENVVLDNLTIENNKINLEKSKMLIFKYGRVSFYNKIIINNNSFYFAHSSNDAFPECINIKNFKHAIVKNNIFKDDIYAYDFETLEIDSNHFRKLYISSNKCDVLSQNNVFDGNDEQCYLIDCYNTQSCKFVSKNNYNKNNKHLIRFFSGGNFLNANNMDIQTIDDINSDEVQKQNNLFIVRDNNVTSDVYKRCFVKTSQELKRFTWYSNTETLIDYKKPHGAIIYNASTGKSTMYITHNGVNKTTTL